MGTLPHLSFWIFGVGKAVYCRTILVDFDLGRGLGLCLGDQLQNAGRDPGSKNVNEMEGRKKI